MNKSELSKRIISACDKVISVKDELTEIDSKFGDADHGFTMEKICTTIKESVEAGADLTIKAMLKKVADDVDEINGGSAVPLWNCWLDGLAGGAPDADEMSIDELKAMFSNGKEELMDFSGFGVGSKTMMDAFIPGSEAIEETDGSEDEIFAAGADAAKKGADATKDMVAKIGRAKFFGDKTIGTMDTGALSMSMFFVGLSEV